VPSEIFARAALLRVTPVVAGEDLVAAFVFFTGFAVTLVRFGSLFSLLGSLGFRHCAFPPVELANHTLVEREVKPNFWWVPRFSLWREC
jgi:hypothetical protein